jgi:hypothetical protein
MQARGPDRCHPAVLAAGSMLASPSVSAAARPLLVAAPYVARYRMAGAGRQIGRPISTTTARRASAVVRYGGRIPVRVPHHNDQRAARRLGNDLGSCGRQRRRGRRDAEVPHAVGRNPGRQAPRHRAHRHVRWRDQLHQHQAHSSHWLAARRCGDSGTSSRPTLQRWPARAEPLLVRK